MFYTNIEKLNMISTLPYAKNMLAYANKIGSYIKKNTQLPKSPKLKTLKEDTFCHKYWQQIKTEGMLKPTNTTSVRLHGYLNGINHHLVTGASPKNMDINFMSLDLTPREMITLTDIDFKKLKPTTEPIKAFRSIGEKPDFFSEYKLYKKRLNIKKGETIDMKEYAYATSDINYAKNYLTNNNGILYEIEIPKGSRVSITGENNDTNEIIFPRSSKFTCVDKEHIKNKDNDYMRIKLRYILPEEI